MSITYIHRLSYMAGLVQILSVILFWMFAIGLALRVVRLGGNE